MRMRKDNPLLEKFFASNAIKNIFDNIRNLMLSTAVLISGHYLWFTIAPDSISPWIPSLFGRMLIVGGALLLILCVLNGYDLLKKAGTSVVIARSISLVYASLAVVFFMALLRSKGILLG